MPAGQIIGRVSVKVLPDTDDFRKDAERKLDVIEKQIKQVSIGTRADMSGVSREFLEEVKKINARNRALDSRKIRFYTMISTDGMTEAISKAIRQLNDRAKTQGQKVKIDADLTATTIQAQLDKESLKEVKKQLDDWVRDTSPLKIEVQVELSRTAQTDVNARLSYLGRARTVQFYPTLDQAAVAKVGATLAALSGARVLGDLSENFGEFLRNLDRSAPKILGIANGLIGIGGAAMASASNLFALSASLASIAPLALTLPGLVGGIGIGLGITVAALKDFNTIFPDMQGKLSALQDQLSSAFWDQAAKPVRQLIDTLFPQFSAGIQTAAGEIGKFFGGLATSITGSLNPLLSGMFSDLAKSISIFTNATPAIAGIIATLGKVGAGELPELAQWLATVTTKFDNFLSTASKDGRLQQWIADAKASLGDLGRVLGNIGGIFAGLSRAATAAGGSTLGIFADTLGRIRDVINSPAFQSGLTNALKAAHTAMSNLADQAGPAVENMFSSLAGSIQTILPQVGENIGRVFGIIAKVISNPAVQNGLATMMQMAGDAITALEPVVQPLAAAFGALAPVIGTIAVNIARLIGSAIGPLSTVLVGLAPVAQTLAAVLGTALLQVFAALGPILVQVGQAFAALVTGALPAFTAIIAALLPVVSELLAAFMPVILALITQLSPVLILLAQSIAKIIIASTPLIIIFQQLAITIIEAVLPALVTLLTEYLPKITDAIVRVINAITPLIAGFAAVVAFVLPILLPALQFLADFLLKSLVAAINGLGLAFEGVVEILSGILHFFVDLFTGQWGKLWGDVLTIFKGAWDLVAGAIEFAFNVGILGMAKKGWELLKLGWTELWPAMLKLFELGFDLIKVAFEGGWTALKVLAQLVWDGIKLAFTDFLAALKAAPGAYLDAIKTLFSDAFTVLKDAVELVWQGIVLTFKTGLTTVKTVLAGLKAIIAAAITNPGAILKTAGTKVITGFIDGLKAGFNAVKSTLGKLTDMLPDWKGPAPKDKTLLYKAGQLIIGGLVSGLESKYSDVEKTLAGLTKLIPKTVSDASYNAIVRQKDLLESLVADWKQSTSDLKDAQQTLADLQKQAADYAQSIRDAVTATGDFTTFDDSSFEGIINGLTAAKDAAWAFQDTVQKLKDSGLNSKSLDEILQAGPKANGYAQAILNAGVAGIAQVNDLQAQINMFADRAGTVGSDAMFKAGIDTAAGFVEGIKSHIAEVNEAMQGVADSMVETIKKALGIHSPSRVMAALGRYSSLGLVQGLKDGGQKVIDTVTGISDSISSTAIALPDVKIKDGSISAQVNGALDSSGSAGGVTKVLNYYAAPGSSINSEEDLFAAANRARMVGW